MALSRQYWRWHIENSARQLSLGSQVASAATPALTAPTLSGRAAILVRLALALGSEHLNQLAPAQYQGMELLQLGIGRPLDEAFTLRMLVQAASN